MVFLQCFKFLLSLGLFTILQHSIHVRETVIVRRRCSQISNCHFTFFVTLVILPLLSFSGYFGHLWQENIWTEEDEGRIHWQCLFVNLTIESILTPANKSSSLYRSYETSISPIFISRSASPTTSGLCSLTNYQLEDDWCAEICAAPSQNLMC